MLELNTKVTSTKVGIGRVKHRSRLDGEVEKVRFRVCARVEH